MLKQGTVREEERDAGTSVKSQLLTAGTGGEAGPGTWPLFCFVTDFNCNLTWIYAA